MLHLPSRPGEVPTRLVPSSNQFHRLGSRDVVFRDRQFFGVLSFKVFNYRGQFTGEGHGRMIGRRGWRAVGFVQWLMLTTTECLMVSDRGYH